MVRILAEKEREEDSIRKRLKAAIESGDKDALAKALQDAKKAGFTDAGKRLNHKNNVDALSLNPCSLS